jgi:predicted deacylase
MHKFLSEDWIKAYKEEWNKNQKLKEELKDFSASIKYYIEGKEGDAVHLTVKNGEAVEAGRRTQRIMTLNSGQAWITGKSSPREIWDQRLPC